MVRFEDVCSSSVTFVKTKRIRVSPERFISNVRGNEK